MAGYSVSISINVNGSAAEAAVKRLDAEIKKAGDEAQRSGDKLNSFLNTEFGGNLAARAVSQLTQYLQQLSQAAIQSALQVEQVVANISSLASINTSAISNQLYDLSRRVPQSAQQLGEGLYNIFSSIEVTQKDSIALLEVFAKGATAARTDTQTFGTAILGLMNAYKLSASEATRVSDVFFNTVNRGVVNGQELAVNLGLVTQAAKNAGVNINELGGLIAGVTKEGGAASQNINNLFNLLLKLPIKDAAEGLKKMGIEMADSSGKFRPILDVLTELKSKLDAMTEQQKRSKISELLPDLQAQTGLSTILNQLDFIKRVTVENAAAAGSAERAYQKMASTAAAQFTVFYNALIELLAKTAEWITQNRLLGTVLAAVAAAMGVMAENTGKILALVAALGLLAAAYNAVAIAAGISGALQAITAFAGGIGGTIFVIQNVARAMIGLQTAFITTAEVAVAATGGWAAILIAVGAAVSIYLSYGDEVRTTSDEMQAGIDVIKGQIDALGVQKSALAGVTANTTQLAASQETLAGIYKTLDTASKDRVDRSTAELGATEALRKEIERLNAAKAFELKTRLAELADKTFASYQTAQQKAADEKRAEAAFRFSIGAPNTTGVKLNPADLLTWRGTIKSADDLRTAYLAATDATKAANTELQKNADILRAGASQTGNSVKSVLDYAQATKNGAGYTEDFTNLLTGASNQQIDFSGRMADTTNTIRDQTNAVGDLVSELKNLMATTQSNVDAKITQIAAGSRNKAEAVAYARSLRLVDSQFNQDLKNIENNRRDIKRIEENQKAIRDALQPASSSEATPRPRASTSRSSNATTGNSTWDAFIRDAAARYNVDERLIVAMMAQESSFASGAVSNKGASGLMQLMPATFRQMGGKNIFDPKQNINAGVKYLRQQLDAFAGDTVLALAAYNAGPGAVRKAGNAVPQFAETQQYVRKIAANYARLGGTGGRVGGGPIDIEQSLREQSDRLTEAAAARSIDDQIAIARQLKLRPDDDTLRGYNRLQVDRARAAGLIQPDLAQTTAEFKNFGQLPEITDQVQQILPDRQTQLWNERDKQFNISGRQTALDERRAFLGDEILQTAQAYAITQQEQLVTARVEYGVLQRRNVAVDAAVKFEQERAAQLRAAGDIQRDLWVLEAQNNNAEFVAERRRVAAAGERLGLERQIAALRDDLANAGANDALVIEAERLRTLLDLRNRERDAVISINRSQLELAQSQKISAVQIKAGLYEYLAGQKTLNQSIVDGITASFDAVGGLLDAQVEKMFSWAGAFKSLFTEPLKQIARDGLGKIFTGVLDAFVPGLGKQFSEATMNPIAKPIVSKLDEIKKILLSGGGAGSTAGGGGGLGSLLGLLTGGGGASGPLSIGGYDASRYTGLLDLNLGAGAPGTRPQGSGGFWSRLTGAGGLFAPRTNQLTGQSSQMAGTIAGIGAIASMVGGFVGGRLGGVLSGIGMGAQLGANFGPWGAAIGAAIGGVLGLFGGDPKRARDKKEKLPQLTKGFTDALAELNSILADIRSLRIDPDDAIRRASDVRAKIAGGFGVEFESKKYQKQSRTMIQSKLREADAIIEEIKQSAEIARGAADRNKRIVPEFAGGHYFADYFKPNGLLPGIFDGRDNILAMISRGEMVLNPQQISRVKALAGADVFAGAGIPNYPQSTAATKFANGGIVGSGFSITAAPAPVIVEPQFTLVLEGATLDERVTAYLQSDDGKRTQIAINKTLRKSGDIK